MKRLFLLILILLLSVGIIAYFIVPWNTLSERRITEFFTSQGFENVSFKINNVGLHEATFNNIRIGLENPFLLQSVTVQYSLKEIIAGNIRNIVLTGLDIKILQTEKGWKIAGIDGLRSSGTKNNATPLLSDIVDLLPFSAITVEDSYLRIAGKSVQASLPFNMHLVKNTKTTLSITINASNIAASSAKASLGAITIKAEPDQNKNWKGEWVLESLGLGENFAIPALKGRGTLNNADDMIVIEGFLASDKKIYNASFSTLINIKESKQNALAIKSAVFPFKQGLVSAKDIHIPFDRKNNIVVNLNVTKVSLNDLMQTLSGQRVTATGTVSGRMPIILKPDGTYTLGKGTLKADGNGLITMPADVIPGDNEQTQLVREILKNLHYSAFSAAVDTSGAKGMAVRLSLEGNNPDIYNGRIVKLNVNLTGDVLDFIQQNAMLFTNPEKLLEQGTQ